MPLSRDWAKSSYSEPNGGNCVEARRPEHARVQVRDSKDPGGPALTFGPKVWATFIGRTKAAR